MTETNANPNALIVPDGPADATNSLPDLRDIKPPVDIPSDWGWLLWLALGALAAALAFWAYRRFRSRKAPAAAEIVIPPHARARTALREAMLHINDPKRFCTLVSNTVRVYLEERFELRAPERTTEEFLLELRDSPQLTQEHKGALSEFLATCDLVKFAKHEPAQTELEAMHTLAHRIVDETEISAPAAESPDTPERPDAA